MKLTNAVELFLNEFRPTTKESYSHVLRDMVNYLGPARPLSSLEPHHLIEYSQEIKSRDYTPGTVHKYVKTLRTFFNWCVKLDLIQKSPASVIKLPRLPKAIDRSKAMTDAELEKILDFVKWKPRDYAMILFLADTGCRAGGVGGLTLDRLDLDNLTAEVIEKGDKKRQVVYGQQTAQAIREWLIQRPPDAGQYVFSRTEGPLPAHNVSRQIRVACKRVGIRTLSAHSLRHRKGHQLADAKVAPTIAATALGHSDPNITLKHYYPADWESAEKELRRLVHESDEKTTRPKVIRLRTGTEK